VKTLVVVSTYNKRGNIERFVGETVRYAPTADLLIIDDDSPDGTGQIADEIHARLAHA
jgi:dolichol-phosphate mannosyltransferase